MAIPLQSFPRAQNFQPVSGNNIACLVPTSTSSNVALPQVAIGPVDVELTNAGNAAAWVAFDIVSTVAAVIPVAGTPANGYPLLPGQSKVVSIGSATTYMAAITASGTTTTLYAAVGQGS